MTKKTRRQRRVNLPPEAFNAPNTMPAPRPSTEMAGSTSTSNGRVPVQINWQEEYGDVLGDLKRTGIIATAMMVVMVALSFIIR